MLEARKKEKSSRMMTMSSTDLAALGSSDSRKGELKIVPLRDRGCFVGYLAGCLFGNGVSLSVQEGDSKAEGNCR
jgi:hypothetical protein